MIMKKFRKKAPGIADFKNKCSEESKSYDPIILKQVYEKVSDRMFSEDLHTVTLPEIINGIRKDLAIDGVYLLRGEGLMLELINYFGQFIEKLNKRVLENSDSMRRVRL
jgi:hypothetical protein